MTYYTARELAHSFRTVRGNTLVIAEEIPEDRYDFRAAPATRSIAEMLAHIATLPVWAHRLHGIERRTFLDFAVFNTYLEQARELERGLGSKATIVEALRRHGEEYAAWLETLTDEMLGELVGFPSPVEPASKSRFEMLLSVKEHEMHHRAQLMLIERMLGIVPHLTRQRQERAEARAAAKG